MVDVAFARQAAAAAGPQAADRRSHLCSLCQLSSRFGLRLAGWQLAAAGGDLSAVRTGLDRALRLSVAYDAAAISTIDPAAMLWTSCFISGLPPGGEDERERILYGLEFAGDDVNSYTELASSGRLVGRLHQATGGDLGRARRWGLLLAGFGICDEMRVLLASRGMVWGSLTLYRRAPRPPFTDRDEAIVRSALTAMADLAGRPRWRGLPA